jgi:pimeloyl-ACP methyl ester carboxylesterase
MQFGCAGPDIRQALPQAGVPTYKATAVRDDALLVVMTFGFGCDGQGPGNGLQELASMIRARHPEQRVITRAWNDHDDIAATIARHAGPVALIGHSFGGSQSVDLAAAIKRPVQWLMLLDPVPCNDWAFRHDGKYFEIPSNVQHAVCFHRPSGGWPTSYGIVNWPDPTADHVRRMGHSDFGANDEVRRQVLDFCDHQALQTRTAQALRPAQKPGDDADHTARGGHRDQVGNAVGHDHQG